MGEYVEILGRPTWIETAGAGERTVLLLHGGLSNADDLLSTIGDALGTTYRLVAFDRRGHGRTADTDDAFHYEDMADQAIGVLEDVVGGAAHLVGWSDGGITAMLVARRRPDLVDRMVLIGANFHCSGVDPIDDLGPDVTAFLGSEYAARSPDGAEHFAEIVTKTLHLFATEPTMTVEDVGGIDHPTLVMIGDDDAARLDHTCQLYTALPNGQLAVVPGASHAVPMEKPALVAAMIMSFLAETGPPATMMPNRRAG